MDKEFESKVINIASVKNDTGVPLTESDINALFLGFVRLVRKNLKMQLEREMNKDYLEANENFRQSLIDLNRTEAMLKKEQEKNLILREKIEEDKKRFCHLFNRYAKVKKAR